ncbi:M20/M25/M40 family metallo-hydrolase [Bradyrhizobium sp. S69]|uniref:M20/M25/M40 family metallo-hydrolase n=1 Tax=Bradyrhizobium sp. S69 TaxID=1641856 RepID=UPI0024C080A1|nr:M20/M25/M40 family metallo-hydrolase [Bradyrhizobium sp. S69]
MARLEAAMAARPPLVFTGHLDTVPLGTRPWTFSPFEGDVRDGKLYGRGVSDMKAGVAAAVAAAVEAATGRPNRNIALILTASEEAGCVGARSIVETGGLGIASALVIAEPTGNLPVIGHKGALHLRVNAAGATAHGSMPELGVNAIYHAAAAIGRIEAYSLSRTPAHDWLGKETAVVGTIRGGQNLNSVPDACEFTIDILTVGDRAHAAILVEIGEVLGEHASVAETVANLPSVFTEPEHPFIACVLRILRKRRPEVAFELGIMPYFSDGSVLQPGYGNCPAIILGPGEASQAHQTDEFCFVPNIRDAKDIYIDLCRSW